MLTGFSDENIERTLSYSFHVPGDKALRFQDIFLSLLFISNHFIPRSQFSSYIRIFLNPGNTQLGLVPDPMSVYIDNTVNFTVVDEREANFFPSNAIGVPLMFCVRVIWKGNKPGGNV